MGKLILVFAIKRSNLTINTCKTKLKKSFFVAVSLEASNTF